MNLNKQELEYIILSIDKNLTNALDMVALKGSLLIKFATELHAQMNPPKQAAPLKEVKKGQND